MDFKTMNINDLTPADYNPRIDLQEDDAEFIKLRNSIEKFGLVDPIIYNERTGNLVGGHQRLKVIKSLGWTEVEVSVVDLSLEDEKALNIALNKIEGGWDEELLENLLDELKMIDYDITLTGFDLDDVEDELDNEIEEDDFDEEPPEEPKAKRGDIYILGRHRLMCGDSTSVEDRAKLLDGNKIDMTFTDPPYNIDYKGVSDDRKIKNDKMPDDVFVKFLEQSIYPSEIMYVCCSWQYNHLFREAMENIGKKPKAMIIWDKVNPAQNLDRYYKQHEIIFYTGPFGGNKTLRGDIWEVKRQKNTVHPTMKPLELIAMAVEDNPEAKNIYDGFGGSGSTLMTCEQLGRNCFMMELDPGYVDVIIKRWEDFTGERARKVEA